MRDVLRVQPGHESLAREDSDYMVAVGPAILVPRQDRERIVSLSPLDIRVPMRLQPGVSCRDGAVVSVVAKIRHDQGHSRQGCEVAGPRCICAVMSRISCGRPVRDGVVLAGIHAAGASGVSVTRHRLAISRNRKAGSQQLSAQRVGREGMGTAIVRHALVGPAPQFVVVGLAWVADCKRLCEQRVLLGQRIDVWRCRATDDLLEGVILHDRDDDMIGTGRRGRCWDGYPQQAQHQANSSSWDQPLRPNANCTETSHAASTSARSRRGPHLLGSQPTSECAAALRHRFRTSGACNEISVDAAVDS